MTRPTLVLLHGFLGAADDWSALQAQLPKVQCIALDLPGHGQAKAQCLRQMADFPGWLTQQLARRQIRQYHLLGYSLGGRLALQFAASHPAGLQSLILENAHPGLSTVADRQLRIQSDARWARRFHRETLPQVLADWYQQPVFQDLSPTEREQLITARSQNSNRALAKILCCCSLARQDDYQGWIKTSTLPILYLCGEQDRKFRQIGTQLAAACPQVQLTCLAGGHNLHRVTPSSMAAVIRQWLNAFPF